MAGETERGSCPPVRGEDAGQRGPLRLEHYAPLPISSRRLAT